MSESKKYAEILEFVAAQIEKLQLSPKQSVVFLQDVTRLVLGDTELEGGLVRSLKEVAAEAKASEIIAVLRRLAAVAKLEGRGRAGE